MQERSDLYPRRGELSSRARLRSPPCSSRVTVHEEAGSSHVFIFCSRGSRLHLRIKAACLIAAFARLSYINATAMMALIPKMIIQESYAPLHWPTMLCGPHWRHFVSPLQVGRSILAPHAWSLADAGMLHAVHVHVHGFQSHLRMDGDASCAGLNKSPFQGTCAHTGTA